MLLVERAIGNRHDDPVLDQRCEEAEHQGRLETLVLALGVAQRRRLRMVASAGTEVGVSLAHGDQLRDGDVLVETRDGWIIVVALERGLVVYFDIDPSVGPSASFESGVRLGHLLGMQHWNFHWKDGRCAVPIVDRRTVEAVLRAHPVPGVHYEFSADESEGESP